MPVPRFLLALFIASLTAAAASAGPWARPDGETFLSFSLDIDSEDAEDSYASIYSEHGLGHRLTLGFDVGGDEQTMSKAIAFVRWTLAAPDAPGQIAVDLGAGVSDDEFALRTGLSLGRGLTLGERSGWYAIDSYALFRGDDLDPLLQTDFTFGVNATPRRKWMVQIQTGAPSDSAAFVKLAPSVAFQRGDGRHILFGVTAGVIETDEIKFNLGLWRKF